MVELMSKPELEKHYLQTTYSVFIEEDKCDIRIGEPVPSNIQQLLNNENKTAAILTAWNPASQPLSSQENISRNELLKHEILKTNYLVFKARGEGDSSQWAAEEGYFILGITKDEIDKLAVKFGQNAYVWLEQGKATLVEFTEIWFK